MNNQIEAIGQLAITVKDISSALTFYRDVLALPFLFSPNENLAFLQCGETRIMLTTPQGSGQIGANSIPYFKVSQIEGFYANAVEQGATAERVPAMAAQMSDHDLWIGFLKDPDGNLIGIMQEKPTEQ
ncbi:VOC family protein [Alteromonas facilis]|uniref:VOC family protein n=1 Tax=Alteromonas facilis TaxID=2048004 RepID=UPI000C28C6AA|nr:VOC family protein [Alteromonas facilis]